MGISVWSSIYENLWYFIIYACIGWFIEVIFCSVKTGKFVNRGFLNGPVCPIYGFGAVSVILLLNPLKDQLILLYIASVLLTSGIEFFGGWILERAFHTRWWDYSEQPFNIKGYVCLTFSLLWGVGCLIVVLGVHPLIALVVQHSMNTFGILLFILFYSILLVDVILTVLTVTKLNRDLDEITRIAETLRKPSEAIAEHLGTRAIETAQELRAEQEQFKIKLEENKVHAKELAQAGKEKVVSVLDAENRLRELYEAVYFGKKRLLKAFPKIRSTKYKEALEKLLLNNKDKNQDK